MPTFLSRITRWDRISLAPAEAITVTATPEGLQWTIGDPFTWTLTDEFTWTVTMSSIPHEIRGMIDGEKRFGAIDMREKLEVNGDTLSGTPTVTPDDTGNITITSPIVNSGNLTINGDNVEAGEAIQFFANGTITPGTIYTLQVTCSTTGGQTVKAKNVKIVGE